MLVDPKIFTRAPGCHKSDLGTTPHNTVGVWATGIFVPIEVISEFLPLVKNTTKGTINRHILKFCLF